MPVRINQSEALIQNFRPIIEWINKPYMIEDENCDILRKQLDGLRNNNRYPEIENVIKRSIYYVYEACLAGYNNDVAERLESLQLTLTKVIEVIRGTRINNPIVELLTLRLECEEQYPGPNDIKQMTKIIIDEVTRVIFNGDPTVFSNPSSRSSSSSNSSTSLEDE